jgi:hypothetical protein
MPVLLALGYRLAAHNIDGGCDVRLVSEDDIGSTGDVAAPADSDVTRRNDEGFSALDLPGKPHRFLDVVPSESVQNDIEGHHHDHVLTAD